MGDDGELVGPVDMHGALGLVDLGLEEVGPVHMHGALGLVDLGLEEVGPVDMHGALGLVDLGLEEVGLVVVLVGEALVESRLGLMEGVAHMIHVVVGVVEARVAAVVVDLGHDPEVAWWYIETRV
ncbi:hypothetical protein vseg_006549 [Gypsophila vaccaria]